jgi:hypothetical protein
MAVFVGMVVVMAGRTGMGREMPCLPVSMIMAATLFAHL